MASVQFYGKEKAIEAYENAKIPAVAIFSNKQIIFRYGGSDIEEGSQLLEDFLTAIEHSNATYTLKVFENTGKNDLRIKEKTECDLSFNFKILPIDEYETRKNERGNGYGMGAVLDKLNSMQNEIADIKQNGIGMIEDEPGNDPGEDWQSIMFDYLKNPHKLGTLVNNLKALANGQMIPETQPAMIGNHVEKISSTGNNADVINEDNKMEKLAAALDILEKNDPKIVDHLVKLAEISNTNKTLFRMLIKNLDEL
jgi:hypothetical protein